MNSVLDQIPSFQSIEPNSKAIDTGSGITYNQSGYTYNQAGQTYGGLYGLDGPLPSGNAVDVHP